MPQSFAHRKPALFLCLVTVTFVLGAGASHAGLMDLGVTTLDTSTGLEWLDIDQSLGFSWQEVELGVGGFLDDEWRHATLSEICGVLVNGGHKQ